MTNSGRGLPTPTAVTWNPLQRFGIPKAVITIRSDVGPQRRGTRTSDRVKATVRRRNHP